jgi:hypothetical protein
MIPAIAILGNNLDAELKRAFQDLASVLLLRAEFFVGANLHEVAGIVCVGDLPETLPAVPVFQFVLEKQKSPDVTGGTIEFAGHKTSPVFLRGRKWPLGKESGWGFLDEKQSGEVVAAINGRPVWKIARVRGSTVWSVSTPLPRLRVGERLSQYLNGETFLPLLPLYLFLRAISSESRWQSPPLRACMVVDDPNLHARSYGHIDFQSLVQLARERPFHAAMAMVPLDGWWTNAATARIFRENPQALSLLIHGNDHLRCELARSFQNGGRDALVFQSLSRIAALEHKANVRVDRVMAPPHGVCAPEMFSALRAGGYEGMTTNRWSLWKHNPPDHLPVNVGLHPADLPGGLPVLNRFRFRSSICEGEILMAAILGQPIIPYGHHQDFSDDMIHVRGVMEKINSLPARWLSLREILETNYEHYLDSGTFHLRPFSRRVKLTLPPDAGSIQIASAPFLAEKPPAFEIISPQKRFYVQTDVSISVPSGVELEIREVAAALLKTSAVHFARKSPAAGLRRVAAEIRDRLKI